ncbi:hypothetical protein [Paraflavitalea sp. CAU 1676]|uniref:hypothetical protein n=1 Tax=Paraflavitalea sp. CAU 1676 TaxID=3032598 RepID=UPI0023DA2BA9|nr:hypothetical protein [Paraflavitalea sp. CAU 1676]MDF2188540.1 hypothetical protein [Paraflavitalea sp. CAU 1676]
MRDLKDVRFYNLARSDYFHFSVSLHGVHLFSTIPVTRRYATWFIDLNKILGEKFPASEGYKVKIKIRTETLAEVDYEELFPEDYPWHFHAGNK